MLFTWLVIRKREYVRHFVSEFLAINKRNPKLFNRPIFGDQALHSEKFSTMNSPNYKLLRYGAGLRSFLKRPNFFNIFRNIGTDIYARCLNLARYLQWYSSDNAVVLLYWCYYSVIGFKIGKHWSVLNHTLAISYSLCDKGYIIWGPKYRLH